MASIIKQHPFEGIEDGQLESGRTLKTMYDLDPFPKISLLDGIYRNEVGKPFTLPSVVQARKRLLSDPAWNHEYPPFLGQQSFLSAMNYRNVFSGLGIECIDLPYYNSYTRTLDFDSFKTAIANLPLGSVVVLQTSAHNPTGCDLSNDQWLEMIQVFLNRRHFAFLDSAYLGLVSGNVESVLDTGSIRAFAGSGVPMLLAATFGKCFSLYGERVGILSIPAPSQEIKKRMQKHLILLARSQTGASPSFGSKVVEIILGDRELRVQWEQDLNEMAAELRSRRERLKEEIKTLQTPGAWDFITDQVGMFSYLGLSERQIDILRTEHHIYINKNGRICFGTLHKTVIKRVARGIHEVLKAQKTAGIE